MSFALFLFRISAVSRAKMLDLVIRRWQSFTGKYAIHVGSCWRFKEFEEI